MSRNQEPKQPKHCTPWTLEFVLCGICSQNVDIYDSVLVRSVFSTFSQNCVYTQHCDAGEVVAVLLCTVALASSFTSVTHKVCRALVPSRAAGETLGCWTSSVLLSTALVGGGGTFSKTKRRRALRVGLAGEPLRLSVAYLISV